MVQIARALINVPCTVCDCDSLVRPHYDLVAIRHVASVCLLVFCMYGCLTYVCYACMYIWLFVCMFVSLCMDVCSLCIPSCYLHIWMCMYVKMGKQSINPMYTCIYVSKCNNTGMCMWHLH